MRYIPLIRSLAGVNENGMPWGAGLRWRPLPQAEAPTEPTGENIPYDAPHIPEKAHFKYLLIPGMRHSYLPQSVTGAIKKATDCCPYRVRYLKTAGIYEIFNCSRGIRFYFVMSIFLAPSLI